MGHFRGSSGGLFKPPLPYLRSLLLALCHTSRFTRADGQTTVHVEQAVTSVTFHGRYGRTHMSVEAADARVQRLGLLSRGALLVAGALFEGRLTTLTVPLAVITPSTHEGLSPLRKVIVAASAGGYAAVARSWWIEQAREVAGLSETEARLLFDQVNSLFLARSLARSVADLRGACPGCCVGWRCQHAAGEGQMGAGRGVSEDE